MRRSFGYLQAVLLLVSFFTVASPVSGEPRTFAPGEKMNFVIKWQGIAVGDAVMRVKESGIEHDDPLWALVWTTKSRSVIDLLYKVRNRYVSHINPEDGRTRVYVAKAREGGRKKHRTYYFDQEENIVTRIDHLDDDAERVFEVMEEVYDVISVFYNYRERDIEPGDQFSMNVFDNRKNYELVVDVLEREEIKTKAGVFKAIKIHPRLKSEGVFRRKGDVFVWLSDDERRLPLLMRSKVKVGKVNAELVRYTDGKGLTLGKEKDD